MGLFSLIIHRFDFWRHIPFEVENHRHWIQEILLAAAEYVAGYKWKTRKFRRKKNSSYYILTFNVKKQELMKQ
jgi:hypothetical protein